MSKPAPSLYVIDVGHGNSAVLIGGDKVIVIDTGPKGAIRELLNQMGISKIDLVMLSHADADADHIGGLVGLIASDEFEIEKVQLNSDAQKDSAAWDDLLQVLDDYDRKEKLDFEISLTQGQKDIIGSEDLEIEIIAPTKYLAGKGPGGRDRKSRKITSNSISAGIRILIGGKPVALFLGDMDEVGFDEMVFSGIDASAPILVFPHHGGRSGSTDMGEFSRKICNAVTPTTIIFSIGRGQHSTPIPDVVFAIRDARGNDARIMCTQLSNHCAENLPEEEPVHLSTAFALGRENRKCCAGTIKIDLSDPQSTIPESTAHLRFISRFAPNALCRS